MHFAKTEFFLAIMPPYIPWHLHCVYASGFAEIFGGIFILLEPVRRAAGRGRQRQPRERQQRTERAAPDRSHPQRSAHDRRSHGATIRSSSPINASAVSTRRTSPGPS